MTPDEFVWLEVFDSFLDPCCSGPWLKATKTFRSSSVMIGPSAGNPFLFRDSRLDLVDPLLLFDDGDDEEEDDKDPDADFEISSRSNVGSCFSTRQNSLIFLN